MSPKQKGMLLVALSTSSFGILPFITRGIYLNSDLTPTDVGIWRLLIAFVVLYIFVAWRQGNIVVRPPLPLWQHIIMGVLYGCAVMGAFFALSYIPGSLFSILVYAYPAIVALVSLALGVKLSGLAWGALALTLVGVVFTVPDPNVLNGANLTGVLITFGTALAAALYFITSSRFMRGMNDALPTTVYMTGVMVLFFLLLIPFFGLRFPPLSVLPNLLFLALVCTVFAFIALNAGIRLIGAPQAAILGSFEPLVSMLMGVIVVGEVLTGVQWFGAALIVVAVILLQIAPSGEKQKVQGGLDAV
jgi:drug/metabolite transporter (DMT)-like permease